MWYFMLVIMLLITGGILFSLVSRFHRFGWIHTLAGNRNRLSWLLSCVPVIILLCFSFISAFGTLVALLHLFLFWTLCDLVGFLVRKTRKKDFLRYYQGAAAIVLTAVYLSIGWYSFHHVCQSEYALQTEKILGTDSLRIVLIADSHLGEMMGADAFAQQIANIQQTEPDLVVLCGDFVDDDTAKEEMLDACESLGTLNTTHGVYFVFGNHDKGYFHSRDFTENDLRAALQANGVTILEDEVVLLNHSIYLIGRQDRSVQERAEISDLLTGLDSSKYMIVLNHQPNDYDNEAASGVDLVLSGHTHGGHIFPVGEIGYILGANDKVYGLEHRDGTDFIVTSGLSGWGIPFKTFTISEYVIIDIAQVT